MIHSSTLKDLTDGLSVSGARSDDTRVLGNLYVSLPALESSSSLDIAPDWARVTVNTAPELNISTDFNLGGNGNMQAGDLYSNVSSTQLFTLYGIDFGYSGEGLLSSPIQRVENLWVSNCSGLTRSLLEDLEFAEYTIVLDSNLDIQNNGRGISVSLPNLKTLRGRSWKWAGANTVDASGVFRDVSNISMPELKEAHGDRRTSGKLNFTSNLFSEIHLPRLETANCTLGIDENAALNDSWPPRLSYVKDLEMHTNPRLLNVTANLPKKADKVNMTGPFTNVEFFTMETVTGDFHLVGDETMDCSWFDEHFLNNIVKGLYKCVGNHTKPETERRPSMPTDEAQLEAWGLGGDQGSKGETGDEKGSDAGGGSTEGGGLSIGAKAGIGAGVIVAVLTAMGFGTWFFIHKKKKHQSPEETPNPESEFQKAELAGESKSSAGAVNKSKEINVTETPHVEEAPDTGKTELPAAAPWAELPA